MKQSENNDLKDKFVCEFYVALLNGIVELNEIDVSSSSSGTSEDISDSLILN